MVVDVITSGEGQVRQNDIVELFYYYKVPICRIAGPDPDLVRCLGRCGGRGEGQEIANRFPFGRTNRRALRLQAQGGFPAGSGAPRNPGNPPRPAGSIPAACWADEKKPPEAVFLNTWWRRRLPSKLLWGSWILKIFRSGEIVTPKITPVMLLVALRWMWCRNLGGR